MNPQQAPLPKQAATSKLAKKPRDHCLVCFGATPQYMLGLMSMLRVLRCPRIPLAEANHPILLLLLPLLEIYSFRLRPPAADNLHLHSLLGSASLQERPHLIDIALQ